GQDPPGDARERSLPGPQPNDQRARRNDDAQDGAELSPKCGQPVRTWAEPIDLEAPSLIARRGCLNQGPEADRTVVAGELLDVERGARSRLPTLTADLTLEGGSDLHLDPELGGPATNDRRRDALGRHETAGPDADDDRSVRDAPDLHPAE